MTVPGNRGTRRVNLALLAVGVLFSVVLLVLALWHLRPGLLLDWIGRGPDPVSAYRVQHPVHHHALKPLADARTPSREGRGVPVRYRTNSFGLRDPERAVPKPPGTFRILMMGDSFIEGVGMESEFTVCAVLERILGRDRPTGRVEVVNGGCASFSPLLESLFLKHTGLRLEPDLVILNLDMSDVQDDYFYEMQAEYGRDGRPVRVPGVFDPAGWQTLRPIREGDISSDRYFHTRGDAAPDRETLAHFDRTWSHILAAYRLARDAGARFLLVAYPMGHQVDAKEWGNGRTYYRFEAGMHRGPLFPYLERKAREADIPYLSLLEGFRRSDTRPLFLDPDGHWNRAGHDLAARLIAEHLAREGFLEGRPPS